MQNSRENIEMLNRLVEINNCRFESYCQAAKEADGPTLKYLFGRLEENSRTCKEELSNEIRKLGGIPKEGISASGKIFTAWMRVKIALSNKNKRVILNSCAYGEDINIKAYEDLLTVSDDPADAYHHLIEKQYSMLKADHERIQNLGKALFKA